MASDHFSASQLERYFDRTKLPKSERIFDVSSLSEDKQLQYLALLTKYQLIAIPFENLTLHYSWHRVIQTDAQHLFDKIVEQPGRGGYCMENNSLFHVVLASLNFDVYMVGSRVYDRDSGTFSGLTHCLNIVTMGADRYTVDVGFGSNMPHRPCKMESELVQDHIQPGQMRLRWDFLPGSRREAGRVWYYEHRQSPEDEWAIQYCFIDAEFLPQDVRSANLAPSTSPTSIFRKTVMCVRFTSEAEIDAEGQLKAVEGTAESSSERPLPREINGALVLFNDTLKWRRNGEKEMEKVLRSESERIDALQRYFGIRFDRKDQEAIKGTGTEIVKGS